MKSPLRSGRLIGGLVFFPCFAAGLGSLYFGAESGPFLFAATIFAAGMGVGAHLIFKPPVLVGVKDGMLELYAGSLGSNKKQIEIPLDEIEGFEVRRVSTGDGFCWLLSLELRTPQKIPEQAQRWIDSCVPEELMIKTGKTTIHWGLSWPAGGVAGAKEKLRQLTGLE
ncbi:MAG: hypothetical protein JNJ70_18125 [Verrucomicrobiales bacterium]|nr:hypothetical protein [Verrucomicrobiales bacterium]